MKKINILGVEYTLEELTEKEDYNLEGVDGYCDTSVKRLVVEQLKPTGKTREKKDLQQYKNTVIRHEIIHAFLFESGLDNCSWANNEEMVDFFAIQFPKILKAFKDVDCL